jgi:hypothetical protein
MKARVNFLLLQQLSLIVQFQPTSAYLCSLCIYRTIILPVVLYGCETWSLIVREGDKLRVFENRMLRRIFGPKGDEMIEGWRKLHNLYYLPNIIRIIKSRRMRLAGHLT